MPVTPFHFGPALFLKGIAPRWVSITAFVATQIAIDLESAYHLLRSEWPIHREIHSLPLSIAVGILVGLAVAFIGRHVLLPKDMSLRAEVLPGPAIVGGLTGGITHPLLDAIMHSDLSPFWPITDRNPLLDLVSLRTPHVACIATGLVGVAVIALRLRWRRTAR